ncbi:hypothetical protein [uncultured Alistipes sp.]|jgi:hypothetical protein|uniref:hypothetical protein n=1 Tax=uncultured Alistipes sp. TaxID=538949 RepID=UPI00259A61E9|nr:hypothetical protein [uncultured Alistipes sp.]
MRTTIEERAKAFCENNICVTCGDRNNCDRKCLGTCIPTYDALEWLIQFGKSQRAELTRWYHPNEEMPEHRKQVLVKTDTENHDVAYYSDNVDGWIANDGIYNTAQIIGWREIHE